jgi:hypothetical protein
MSEITPAPWRATQGDAVAGSDDWDGKETQHICIVGPDGQDVIAGCGECGSPWIENPADLRVLVAAPLLLSALKGLAAWANLKEDSETHGALAREANGALAAAEGA